MAPNRDVAKNVSDANRPLRRKKVLLRRPQDYPIYAEVPETAFSCNGQVDGGYYADTDAQCQVRWFPGIQDGKKIS
jgi:hypothetical protein